MRKPLKPLMWIIALSSLAAPATALAVDEACENLCKEYREGSPSGQPGIMSYAYATTKCGAPPTNGQSAQAGTGTMFNGQAGQTNANAGSGADPSQMAINPEMKSGTESWDKCFAALNAQWGQYAQHCQSMDVRGMAIDAETVSLIFYATATATCTTACVAESTGVLAWMKGFCMGTSIGAAVADISSSIYLGVNSSAELNYWANAASIATGVVGAAGGTIWTGAAMAGMENAQSQSLDTVASSCLTAVVMGAATALKTGNLIAQKNGADDACEKLQGFISEHELPAVVIASTPTPTPTSDGGGSGGGDESRRGGGGNGKSGIGAGNRTGGTSLSGAVKTAMRDFPNSSVFAAATAGDVFAPVFKAIGNKDQIKDSLKQAAGLSIEDLAKKVTSGQSMSQIMGNVPGMEKAAGALAKVEKDVKDGKFKLKGGASLGATYSKSGGGAAPSSAKPNPFAAMMGMKGPGGLDGAAPGELAIDKAKRELASSEANGDIWHEGYGGTIFQIVSHKLDKTRERIDQLEWDTPLNRALVGLPAKKVLK